MPELPTKYTVDLFFVCAIQGFEYRGISEVMFDGHCLRGMSSVFYDGYLKAKERRGILVRM